MLKVTLQQGSDSWLNWRREGLTATEAGVILNQNPNKSPWRLWMEKKEKQHRKTCLRFLPFVSAEKTRTRPARFSKVLIQRRRLPFVPNGMPTEDFVRALTV